SGPYTIWRSTDGTNFSQVGGQTSATSVTHYGLDDLRTYDYKIYSVSAGQWTDVASATTQISGLQASSDSTANTVTLSWHVPNRPNILFEIRRSTINDVEGATILTQE